MSSNHEEVEDEPYYSSSDSSDEDSGDEEETPLDTLPPAQAQKVGSDEEIASQDAPVEPSIPSSDFRTIVIDAGSGTFKAGFAGETMPRALFPTVVGLPRVRGEAQAVMRRKQLAKQKQDREENLLKKETLALASVNGLSAADALQIFEQEFQKQRVDVGPVDPLQYRVGNEAINNMSNLNLSYPIERGNIVKWDEMECLYEHVFVDCLEVDPSENLVLVAEMPFTSRKSREQTAEIMFETFMVPGLSIVSQALLSLYGSGRTTGLVVDCGDGVTHAIPVYEGYLIPNAIQRMNLGGRDVTYHLQRILTERGYYFDSTSEHHMVRLVKENLAFVTENYARDSSHKAKDSEFLSSITLPDGQTVELGKERFRAPEVLFQPMLIGREEQGLADITMKAFRCCDYTVRNALYNNVVLAGGSTLFKGFKERLQQDLNNHEHSFKSFTVLADESRQYISWQGGSLFGGLSTFLDSCISYDEYEDYGVNIVHRKMGTMQLLYCM